MKLNPSATLPSLQSSSPNDDSSSPSSQWKNWAAESYTDHGNVLVMTRSPSPQKKKSNISVITSSQPSWAEKVSSFFPLQTEVMGLQQLSQEIKTEKVRIRTAGTDSCSIHCVYHPYFNHTAHAPNNSTADKYVWHDVTTRNGLSFPSIPGWEGNFAICSLLNLSILHFLPC